LRTNDIHSFLEIILDEPKAGHPHTEYQHPHHHKPYWRRAHRDWKIWAGVVLMLIAMWVYLKSNDLSHSPESPPNSPLHQPVP
jgi:hypothetical protein